MKETPVLMGVHGALFGICTESKSTAGCGVIILNAGLLHHVGPYRLHVTLARALAELGCPVIRIDQSGKGESPLRKGLSSDESLLRDFDDAVAELGRRGVSSVLLAGLCSGADDALFIAQRRTNVAGLILLDGFAARTQRFYFNHSRQRVLKVGPWLRAFRRIMQNVLLKSGHHEDSSVIDIRNWSNTDEMLARFAQILSSGTRVLAVFTGGVMDYYNYQGQLSDSLGLSLGESKLTEIYYPEADHTYPLVIHRMRLIDEVLQWVAKHFR